MADTLNEMSIFAKVVASGSLSAAARATVRRELDGERLAGTLTHLFEGALA